MINYLKLKRAIFFALFINIFFNPFLFASLNGFIYDGEKGILLDKTVNKMREMGEELYQKTKISTVIVVRKHLNKKEFLSLKNKYIKETQKPYVIWIFAKTYMDRDNVGINQMFNSPELNDKFDKDSLFSPFTGTFTKILTVHKSKVDPTSAAFLNGYGDLVDMLADSYHIKLKSSIGSGSHYSLDIIRIIFYSLIFLVILRFIYMKFKNPSKN